MLKRRHWQERAIFLTASSVAAGKPELAGALCLAKETVEAGTPGVPKVGTKVPTGLSGVEASKETNPASPVASNFLLDIAST